MTIKLALLKSGETLISEIKELVSEDSEGSGNNQVYGYIFSNPEKVITQTPILVSENTKEDQSSVQVSLSPWIILSKDKDILVSKNWVITFVEPIESLKVMYEEKVNGSNN
jgi:hypothetical protein